MPWHSKWLPQPILEVRAKCIFQYHNCYGADVRSENEDKKVKDGKGRNVVIWLICIGKRNVYLHSVVVLFSTLEEILTQESLDEIIIFADVDALDRNGDKSTKTETEVLQDKT